MTLPKISKKWMIWSVTKNQLSVTVLLTPPLVLWDMEPLRSPDIPGPTELLIARYCTD